MTQGARTERVGEEFREILAEQIQKLKDPRVGFVTVTGVKVSPDLKHAWVYYTCLGDDSASAGSRARRCGRRRPICVRRLGREVRLKFLPELEFEEDADLRAGPSGSTRSWPSSTGRSEPSEPTNLDAPAAVLAGPPRWPWPATSTPTPTPWARCWGSRRSCESRGVSTTVSSTRTSRWILRDGPRCCPARTDLVPVRAIPQGAGRHGDVRLRRLRPPRDAWATRRRARAR